MTTTTPEHVQLAQTGLSDANSQPDEEAPPPYGSKRYWEERYSKHSNKRHKADEDTGDEKTEDPLPGHSWYFTYEELRPLIMPLILGKDENSHDESENDDSENEESTAKQITSGDNSSTKHSESDKESKKGSIDILESESEPNFAKPGLKRILEIGCGDMPLGANLADEMNRLQGGTPAKPTSIDKIVCCDYSEIVIQELKGEQSQKEQHEAEKKIDGAIKAVYEIEDARQLSYANESYDLVIDKGTLDAMLSDKKNGIDNCMKIVSECARVLATNGNLVLVSHLNAHVSSGIKWLNEVVLPGLRSGGPDAKWEIEVHGNDGSNDEDGSDDEEVDESMEEGEAWEETEGSECEFEESTENDVDDVAIEEDDGNTESSPASGSAGPAVYIIHKLLITGERKKSESPVPLKFFTY